MLSDVRQQPPRTDPRIARTHKLIRDALTSLMLQKSFESITVQDVAERATINRATFYAHYTDKFALLDALVREDVAARLAVGDPLTEQRLETMLLAIGNNVFAYVASKSKCRIDRDFEPHLQQAMETELAAFLASAFEQGAAMLIAWAIVGGAMHWRHHTPKLPIEPIVANIVEMLAGGVTTRSR